MTIDEFNEYAKSHDYVVFTKQQYEHVVDIMNGYDLLQLDYLCRLKADMVAELDKIRAEIQNGTHHFLDGEPIIEIKEVLQIIDKYKAETEET